MVPPAWKKLQRGVAGAGGTLPPTVSVRDSLDLDFGQSSYAGDVLRADIRPSASMTQRFDQQRESRRMLAAARIIKGSRDDLQSFDGFVVATQTLAKKGRKRPVRSLFTK